MYVGDPIQMVFKANGAEVNCRSLVRKSDQKNRSVAVRVRCQSRTIQKQPRLLSLSEGVLVRICRLIERAAIDAIRSGRERIDLTCLTEELMAGSLVFIADRRNRRVVSR